MPKRRRGARSASLGPRRSGRLRSGHVDFEDLVDEALAAIPEPFSRALDEVAIVIDEEPSPEQRRDNHLGPRDTLYGLYEGVPRTAWNADFSVVPNKITLFRRPLEEDFADPDDLADEVRVTVLHELAHHLGIDDDRLDELGMH